MKKILIDTEESSFQGLMPQPVQVDLGALSHAGNVRPINEDHYFVASFERGMKTLLTNVPAEEIPAQYVETAYGMLVADGMGGAAGGEVASRTAISALIELVLRTPDWIMRLNEDLAKAVLERLAQRIEQAETRLLERARRDPSLVGMGTTMTIVCSIGFNLLIAHVGDSRAYLGRGGKIYRLTSDHTVAQELADMGAIRRERVASHPMHHVLTHVVGSKGGRALADLSSLHLSDGDRILLCTDGLTDMVEDAAIARALAGEKPAAELCQELTAMALAAGGLDNITAVVARYSA
jgi:protein phosphatase